MPPTGPGLPQMPPGQPGTPYGRPPARRRRVGQLVAIIGTLVLLTVLFIAWQASQADRIAGNGELVPFDGPQGTVRVDENANRPVDAVPDGFGTYSNAELGFTMAFPKSWGELKPTGEAGLLNLATPSLQAYSLSEAMQVRVRPMAEYRHAANEQGVLIAPQAKGAGYEWLIVDKGSAKTAPVGRPFSPAPSLAKSSGKTVVYRILNGRANCTFVTYAFPAGANFVSVRLPSFCVSDKPADADIQVGHKNDYEKQQSLILQSITAL
jgi:hypothetical protein